MNKVLQKMLLLLIVGMLVLTSLTSVFLPSVSAATTSKSTSASKPILPPGVTLIPGNYKEPAIPPAKVIEFDEDAVTHNVYGTSTQNSLGARSMSIMDNTESAVEDAIPAEEKEPIPYVAVSALTTQQVIDLMDAGANAYDRYQIHLLASQQTIDPLAIWEQKQKSGLSWKEWLSQSELQLADPSSVSQDVYGVDPNIEIDSAKTSVQEDTYIVKPLSTMRSLSSQDDEINLDQQTLTGYRNLINPQQMNQIKKEQYSDRQKTSETIDPATGALTWKFNALSYPGRDGLDMDLGLMYQSSQAKSFLSAKGLYLVLNSVRGYEYQNTASYMWQTSNYLVDRYHLGNGWSFQFPSVQNEEGSMYYHDGQGASYQIKFDQKTGLAVDTNIVDPPNKLTKFMKDNGSFSNGQTSSAFYMQYPDKKREYFNSNGYIIGVVDRYNNKLTYEYGETPNRYIQITDTVGRKLKIVYENAGVEGTITVYSITPDGQQQAEIVMKNQAQSIAYKDRGTYGTEKKDAIRDVNPVLQNISYVHDNASGQREYLWSTTFNYDPRIDEFSYAEKQYNTKSGFNAYFLLNEINYPRSQTYYTYEEKTRNLGPEGMIQDFIVNHRSDEHNKKDGSRKTNLVNQVEYTYSGDYTGYPNNNPDAIPADYTYSSRSSVLDGIGSYTTRTRTRYNNLAQKISTDQLTASGDRVLETVQSYHPIFKFMPVKTEKTLQDNSGVNLLYTENIYNDVGNLVETTKPLTAAQFGDSNFKRTHTTSYTYESQYNQVATVTSYQQDNVNAPLTERYSYTNEGRLRSKVDTANQETTYAYSTVSGMVNQVTEEHPVKPGVKARTVTEYGAETNYALPSKVSSYFRSATNGSELQNSKSMTYDPRTGQVLQEKDAEGKITSYTYDLLDRVIAIKSPSVTNTDGEVYDTIEGYEYNDAYIDRQDGSPVVKGLSVNTYKDYTQRSTGVVTTLNESNATYDGFGNALTESYIDRKSTLAETNVHMTRYTTDGLSRPTKQTTAVYHPANGGASLELASGPNTDVAVTYDGWGKVNETKDVQGNKVSSTSYLTQYRNELTFTDANGNKLNAVDQQYDQWGNMLKTTAYQDPNGKGGPVEESYTYDVVGNVLSYIDPKGNKNNEGATQTFRYDGLNRLISLKDAKSQTASYQYDGNNQLTQVSMSDASGADKAVIFSKDFNEASQMLSKTDAASQSTQNQFDKLGRVQSSTDRNGSNTAYTYDEANQLTSYQKTMTSPKAQTVKYTYTPGKGNIYTNKATLQTTGLPLISQQTKIDQLGRIIQQHAYTTSTDYVGTTNLAYNGWGQVASNQTSYQASADTIVKGTQQSYTYNTKQQLTGINMAGTTKGIQYTYTPQGKIESITYPAMTNGKVLKTTYTYNALSQMLSMKNELDGVELSSSTNGYDTNGNIIQTIEKRQGQADRVTTYDYDPLNRLISLNESGKGTASYTYDLRGNRLTLEDNRGQANALENLKETNYSYNALDQLDSYQQDKTSTSFRYLPDGTRYQKQTTVTNTDGTKTTTSSKFISNGNGKVTFEAKGTDYNEYVRGDRVLLKKKPGSNSLQYYLYNGHGDVIGLLYDNGTVANTYDYDEFGNLITQQEKTYNPFKYAGEYQDSESGLYYLNARYYDPSMGRFLNEDSYEGQIDNPLSLNNYAYVNNNPLGYIDPSGHITESYNDGALRNLLKDARNQVTSKSDVLYSKYKAKITEIYGNFTDENTYNYLFDLTTGTSPYGNSTGKSDWAIGQLISAYQADEAADYIVALAMGSLGGGLGSNKSSKYEDVTKSGSRYANRSIDVTKSDFEKVLLKDGWQKSASKDGKTIILTKDGAKYVLRDAAKSTGGPTADFYPDGSKKFILKIRLK